MDVYGLKLQNKETEKANSLDWVWTVLEAFYPCITPECHTVNLQWQITCFVCNQVVWRDASCRLLWLLSEARGSLEHALCLVISCMYSLKVQASSEDLLWPHRVPVLYISQGGHDWVVVKKSTEWRVWIHPHWKASLAQVYAFLVWLDICSMLSIVLDLCL